MRVFNGWVPDNRFGDEWDGMLYEYLASLLLYTHPTWLLAYLKNGPSLVKLGPRGISLPLPKESGQTRQDSVAGKLWN